MATEAELIEKTREAGREFLRTHPKAFGGGIDPRTGVRRVGGRRVSVPGSKESEEEIKKIEAKKEEASKLTSSLIAREELRQKALLRGVGLTRLQLQKGLKERGTSISELREATRAARTQFKRTGVSVTEQIRQRAEQMRRVGEVKVTIKEPTLQQIIQRAVVSLDPGKLIGSGTFTKAIDVGDGKMQDFVFRFSNGKVTKTTPLGTPIPQTKRFIESKREADKNAFDIIEEEIKNIKDMPTTKKEEKQKRNLIEKIQNKIDQFFEKDNTKKTRLELFLESKRQPLPEEIKGAEVFVTPTGVKQLSNLGAEIALQGGTLLSNSLEKLFKPVTPEAKLLFGAKPKKLTKKEVRGIIGDIFVIEAFSPFIKIAAFRKGSSKAKVVEKQVKKIDKEKIDQLRNFREKIKTASESETKNIVKKEINNIKKLGLTKEQEIERLRNLEIIVREARGQIKFENGKIIPIIDIAKLPPGKPIGSIRPGKVSIEIEIPKIIRLEKTGEILSSTSIFGRPSVFAGTGRFERTEATGSRISQDLSLINDRLRQTGLNDFEMQGLRSRQNMLQQELLLNKNQQALQTQQLSDQLNRQLQQNKQKQDSLTRQLSLTTNVQRQEQLQKQLQETRQRQKLLSISLLKLKLQLKKFPRIKRIGIKRIIKKPKFKIPFFLKKKKRKKERFKKIPISKLGYDALVKKSKSNKFLRLNRVPIKERYALSLTARGIDFSIAATGKIVRTDKKAQKPLVAFDKRYFQRNRFKFRGRIVKGIKQPIRNIIIEKRKFRLDRKGETRSIQAFKKSLKLRKPVKKPIKKLVKKPIKKIIKIQPKPFKSKSNFKTTKLIKLRRKK